ncbi:MAG: hypothetical protein OEV74_18825 [Cyclobacteriaceae bacterium]|nr:hypothetical protein [Cyclobacteriaceae bacterium]
MARILFSAILVIHGLVHLLGFVKEWNLTSNSQLTGKTLFELSATSGKVVDLLWLTACILLLVVTGLYLMHKPWYWIPAAAAVLLSQALIILYWPNAKYGTIANIIILSVVVISAAAMRFHTIVHNEIRHIAAAAGTHRLRVTEEKVKDLPEIVQRWLRQSNILEKESANTIHILQQGSMRTKPDGKWMPFKAEQYFTVDPPAFVWHATIQAAPLTEIAGRDKFENGKGNMLIKPLYVYTIANSSGSAIDEATMVRYLAEMMWFPQGAVSDYLHWEGIDDSHAKVTMKLGDVAVTGVYTFNEDGRPIGFEAARFGDFDGVLRKETWSIAVKGFRNMHGVPIGNTSEVTWKLKDGDFTWLKLEITDMN